MRNTQFAGAVPSVPSVMRRGLRLRSMAPPPGPTGFGGTGWFVSGSAAAWTRRSERDPLAAQAMIGGLNVGPKTGEPSAVTCACKLSSSCRLRVAAGAEARAGSCAGAFAVPRLREAPAYRRGKVQRPGAWPRSRSLHLAHTHPDAHVVRFPHFPSSEYDAQQPQIDSRPAPRGKGGGRAYRSAHARIRSGRHETADRRRSRHDGRQGPAACWRHSSADSRCN